MVHGFEEDRKGSIQGGRLADSAILSDDPMTCDLERMKHIRSLLTVVGGRVVHDAVS